jgi:hypothetical protein
VSQYAFPDKIYSVYFFPWLSSIIILIKAKTGFITSIRYGEKYKLRNIRYAVISIVSISYGTKPSTAPPMSHYHGNGAVSTSETSVNLNETTRHIPEDSHLHTRRSENLECHKITVMSEYHMDPCWSLTPVTWFKRRRLERYILIRLIKWVSSFDEYR